MQNTFSRCLLVAAAFAGLGQGQLERGAILGTVTDPNGVGVANAKVTATNPDNKAKVSATTASDGVYRISNLGGVYNVAITAAGFKQTISERVQVRAGETVRVDAQMELTTRAEVKALTALGQGLSAPSQSFSEDWLKSNWLRDPQTYEDASRGPKHHEENGIHACQSGYAILAVDLDNDALLCHQVTADTRSEESKIDDSPDTQRQGQHACPAGWYMRGVSEREIRKKLGPLQSSAYEFLLLCSRSPGVTLNREQKAGGTVCEDARPKLRLPIAVMTGICEAKWWNRSLTTTLCARFGEDPPGRSVFEKYCGPCHGTDGIYEPLGNSRTDGIGTLPSLFNRITEVEGQSDADRLKIYEGKHWGDAWAREWAVPKLRIKLSAKDAEDLVEYIRTFKE